LVELDLAKPSEAKINLFLVVHEYAKYIAPTFPMEAVAYYYVLQNFKAATRLVIELVVDNGLQQELIPMRGFTDVRGKSYSVEDVFTKEWATQLLPDAAKRAQQRGNYVAMVDLYLTAIELSKMPMDTSKEYTRALLEVICRELSCVLPVGSPNRQEVLPLAEKVYIAFQTSDGHRFRESLKEDFKVFDLLVQFALFFDCIRDQRDAKAFEIAKKCDILPNNPGDTMRKAKDCQGLKEYIKKNIPDFLLGYMNLLDRSKEFYRSQAEARQLKEQAGCAYDVMVQSGIPLSIDARNRLEQLRRSVDARVQ
jgi:hypothetical protein